MRRLLPIVVVSLALAAGGCGGSDETTPVACREGPGPYLHALHVAPAKVTLPGGVAISHCLTENQKAGDLAAVGTAMVGAATALNAEARKEPGGQANVELGYLIGAEQRGAEGTGGIHAELTRRLVSAATYRPGKQVLRKDFERAYRRGFDAGLAEG